MRAYKVLTFVTVLMSFLAGYLLLHLSSLQNSKLAYPLQIAELKNEFQKTHATHVKLNPLSFYEANTVKELLSASSLLPQTYRYPLRDLRSLFLFSKSCKDSDLKRADIGGLLKKELLWQDFRCHKTDALPADFFEQSPLMNPFGQSYAWLYYQEKKSILPESWIEEHLHFFHVNELKLLGKVNLPSHLKVLTSLDFNSLQSVSEKETFILGEKYLLIQEKRKSLFVNGIELNDGSNTYDVFPLADWNRFIEAKSLVLKSNIPENLCLQKEGSLCWVENDNTFYRLFWSSSFFLFGGSLLLLGIALYLLFTRIQSQKLQEERKKFALQSLTHELRTPLSSLVVSTDLLLKHFDSLPESSQEHLLRVCDDVQRLKRLAEVSQQYLSANHSDGKVVQFKTQKIDSINDFFVAHLGSYEGKVLFSPQTIDKEFTLDTYWTGVCLKNLVENALHHGVSPVHISWKCNEKTLELLVEDQGEVLLRDGENFYKGEHSLGLGLGLTIVKKVIEDMEGEFIVKNKPTQFGFRIGELS